jgi:hypothetical protein
MSSKGWGICLPIRKFKALRLFNGLRLIEICVYHIHPLLKPWAIKNIVKIDGVKYGTIFIGAGFLTGVMADLIGFKSNPASS